MRGLERARGPRCIYDTLFYASRSAKVHQPVPQATAIGQILKHFCSVRLNLFLPCQYDETPPNTTCSSAPQLSTPQPPLSLIPGMNSKRNAIRYQSVRAHERERHGQAFPVTRVRPLTQFFKSQ
jgi:hypothetical protein